MMRSIRPKSGLNRSDFKDFGRLSIGTLGKIRISVATDQNFKNIAHLALSLHG